MTSLLSHGSGSQAPSGEYSLKKHISVYDSLCFSETCHNTVYWVFVVLLALVIIRYLLALIILKGVVKEYHRIGPVRPAHLGVCSVTS